MNDQTLNLIQKLIDALNANTAAHTGKSTHVETKEVEEVETSKQRRTRKTKAEVEPEEVEEVEVEEDETQKAKPTKPAKVTITPKLVRELTTELMDAGVKSSTLKQMIKDTGFDTLATCDEDALAEIYPKLLEIKAGLITLGLESDSDDVL